MSRVFSYEQIIEDQIPDHIDFHDAETDFKELSRTGVEAEIIYGSFIFGSVALGVANRRSDFDSFICMEESSDSSYDYIKDIYVSIAEDNPSIALTPMVYPKRALHQGRHDIDRFFGQHLSGAQRIVIGRDPSSIIKYSTQPAGDILANYLAQKKRHLSNAYVAPEPLDYREGCGVQRMLELPVAVGRKVVQAFIEDGLFDEQLENSADKAAVIQKTRYLMAEHHIAKVFDSLVRCNNQYDELLDSAINGELSKIDYELRYGYFFGQLPYAINWLETVEQTLLPRLPRSIN